MAALRKVVLTVHLVLLNELHLQETINLAEDNVVEHFGRSHTNQIEVAIERAVSVEAATTATALVAFTLAHEGLRATPVTIVAPDIEVLQLVDNGP